MRVLMQKTPGGTLAPLGQDATEMVAKLRIGQPVWCDVVRTGNNKLFRKWFVLLDIGYEAFEPMPVKTSGGMEIVPEKNRERFRKEVTIMAGFHELVATLDGRVRVEAKSVSPDRMPPEEFERLYSATINVLLKLVIKGKTADELDAWVNQIMRFD